MPRFKEYSYVEKGTLLTKLNYFSVVSGNGRRRDPSGGDTSACLKE